ncbi:hypothetical protein AZA_17582 [Nitrospirillum viridazoti Y2]|nr:hypothetical protein AZA_17582 [Nitrospirillum amazonense Y2]
MDEAASCRTPAGARPFPCPPVVTAFILTYSSRIVRRAGGGRRREHHSVFFACSLFEPIASPGRPD